VSLNCPAPGVVCRDRHPIGHLCGQLADRTCLPRDGASGTRAGGG
jgi:hypothetical protein